MYHPACWAILAALSLLTTPSFAEDQIFADCTGEWFRMIRQSTEYDQFVNGDLDTNGVSEDDLSKLALVAAFSSNANLSKSFDVILEYSNKYTAAALYACLQGYIGDPDQAHGRFRQFSEAHPIATAEELKAAFFAYIQDEPSSHTCFRVEILPIPLPTIVEVNMSSAFAELLANRNQAYMYREWVRLSKFKQNDRAKTSARAALKTLSSSSEADDFTSVAEAIRRLYRRACCKRIIVHQRTTKTLPGPYEDFSIRLGDVTGGQVPVAILNRNDKAIQDESMRQGERRLLPQIVEGNYELRVVRLFNWPIGKDYCVFSIKPVFLVDTP